ncbi:unnamed protein product [Rhizophagus irregularis]|nr:unnamed protein product [Rhizophagus irregularis]
MFGETTSSEKHSRRKQYSIRNISYKFDVVVSSKRTKIAQGGVLPNIHQNLLPKKSKKGAKWTVNIEHATLEGFKNSIRAINQTSALENDGAVLNMLNDSGKYSPKNDQALCEMLQLLVFPEGMPTLRARQTEGPSQDHSNQRK